MNRFTSSSSLKPLATLKEKKVTNGNAESDFDLETKDANSESIFDDSDDDNGDDNENKKKKKSKNKSLYPTQNSVLRDATQNQKSTFVDEAFRIYTLPRKDDENYQIYSEEYPSDSSANVYIFNVTAKRPYKRKKNDDFMAGVLFEDEDEVNLPSEGEIVTLYTYRLDGSMGNFVGLFAVQRLVSEKRRKSGMIIMMKI